MSNVAFDKKENQSGSAVAKMTPSAQELGEMMNTNPGYLFSSVDIGQVTDWYTNNDFMEEMLSYVKDEERINALIEYIQVRQEYQVTNEHHPKVCYRVTDERKYAPYVDDLSVRLEAMRVRIMHSREVCSQLERLKNQWSEPDLTKLSAGMESNDTTETTAPHFEKQTDDTADTPQIKYHKHDFNEKMLGCLYIDDDEIFSLFVSLMREKLWPAVEDNKNKYSNLLRFLLMYHGVIGDKTSMPQFNLLLQEIIPGIGNQLSSLKQRQDVNNKKNLDYYGDPRQRKNDFCYKITRDAPKLEKLLQPLLDIIEKKKDDN
jgi:hypothetical protein